MRLFLLLMILLSMVGSLSAQDTEQTRNFYLGFTPFPYEISLDGVQFAYDALENDADIVAHHFDNGIPWNEALNGEPYHENIMGDWRLRQSMTSADSIVYVAVTPISLLRNSLAPYRGEADDMPLPEPWASYEFDHHDVKQAYYNHVVNTIEFFQPDYLAIGIEANLLWNENPTLWDAYFELHQDTYTALKARYPDLPIFVSVLGVAFMDGYRDEDDAPKHRDLLLDLMEYSDLYGISLYPYLTSLLTNDIPDSMWEAMFSLVDKPIAVTETGYPAQAFTVANIPFNGTPDKQNTFIARLLQEAEARDFEFVINFINRDYDELYNQIDGGDLELLWRDTGLWDEDGNPRLALTTWRDWLSKPVE